MSFVRTHLFLTLMCRSSHVIFLLVRLLYLLFTCSPLLFLDILADHSSPLLQDPDILPYTSYPSMQYPSMEPTMSSTPYYSSQNYYPQYNEDEWYTHTGIYELRKGPLEVSYDAEMEETSAVLPTVCKRPRHMSQAGRVKGEELCVVCGDKASGYHYNALTCEGCKGEIQNHNILIPTPYVILIPYVVCVFFLHWTDIIRAVDVKGTVLYRYFKHHK